jgi:hypothetical protein
MEAVIACGKGQKAAADYIVRQIGPAVERLRTRSVKGSAAGAVLTWYSAFSANSVSSNQFAQHNFNRHRKPIRAQILLHPEEARLAGAKQYLREVASKIPLDQPPGLVRQTV